MNVSGRILSRALGVCDRTIIRRRRAGALIGIKCNGRWLYSADQFNPEVQGVIAGALRDEDAKALMRAIAAEEAKISLCYERLKNPGRGVSKAGIESRIDRATDERDRLERQLILVLGEDFDG